MDTTLNIYFDKKGINYLGSTNQLVGIIRSYPGMSDFKFICLAFEPFINNNQCVFSDCWKAVVSRNAPQSMTVYQENDSTDAQYGKRYAVSNSGFFGTPENCPSDVIGIANASNSVLYPGISQKINDGYGVCDANMASINTINYFDYSDELWLFTASGIASNMAIPSSLFVPSFNKSRGLTMNKYLPFIFTDDTDVYFDSATNLFKLGSIPQKK